MSPGDLKHSRRQSEVFLQKRLSDGLLIGDFIAMFNIILLTIAISAILPDTSRSVMAMALDLDQFQWKNRLLFLFAPNRNHPLFEALLKSLAAQKTEAADRYLVVFEILESDPSSMNSKYLASEAALSLRKRYKVNQGEFAVLLVDKDGGIKLNRQNETRLEDIFTLIDTMPMRQEEMRQKSRIGESDTAAPNNSGGVE